MMLQVNPEREPTITQPSAFRTPFSSVADTDRRRIILLFGLHNDDGDVAKPCAPATCHASPDISY